MPVSALVTNSSMPNGGVISPIIMLTTTTTPKWTRSMPSSLAAGSSIGTNTSSITETSRKQPSTRNTTLTSSRNCSCERSMESTHSASACGTPSEVKA